MNQYKIAYNMKYVLVVNEEILDLQLMLIGPK